MPTRNISLTEYFDRFVEESIRSGRYLNASEVVREGLRLLESRQREEQLKLQRLREAIDSGFTEIDRGDYHAVEADKIGQYIADIGKQVAGRRRNARK